MAKKDIVEVAAGARDIAAVKKFQVELAEKQIVDQLTRIEFYLTEYSLELLASKMALGEFVVPNYQREDTWEPARKTRFIESVLMGLPIPFLFFWERPDDGKLEIVDGSQRLRTIHQFLNDKLEFGEMDQLTALEGLKFSDLPEGRQRKIRNRSIRGIVLNDKTNEQSRFELFDRINTGSKIANMAEVRRGALIGPFLDLVIELSDNKEFVELAPVTEKSINLREREELITRFFAYGDGLEGYKDRPSDFLFDYAKKMNEKLTKSSAKVRSYRKRFQDCMTFCRKIFPIGFRRTPKGTETPRTRFEALAIGAHLAITQDPELLHRTPGIEWMETEEFKRYTKSGGANAISSLRKRIYFVRDQLLGVQS